MKILGQLRLHQLPPRHRQALTAEREKITLTPRRQHAASPRPVVAPGAHRSKAAAVRGPTSSRATLSWCSRSSTKNFTQDGSRTRSQRCQWSAASWRHPPPTARGRSGWPTGCMAGQNWVGGCSEHPPSPICSTLCREAQRCHLAHRQKCGLHSDLLGSERMASWHECGWKRGPGVPRAPSVTD